MIFLEAALLIDIRFLYDFTRTKVDREKVAQWITKLHNLYSNNFVELIKTLLSFVPEERSLAYTLLEAAIM